MAEKFDAALLISSVEALGIRRAAFARAAGVDRSTITRLAAGEIRRPSHELVVKLQSGAAIVSRTQQKTG